MKKLISTAILLAMFATFCTLKAQTQKEEYLGLPGDNLNLYAVMKLFQESETLEGFEKNLNDENSRINNLDLNEDNYVDYIKVIDYVDGEVHNIVLQVSVNAKENQDVAVFTVQRFTNGQVQIQLIGDADLYGKNYIIEPVYDENIAGQTPNPGYMGNSGNNVTVARTTTYEIASWPVIRFIYLPNYRVWHSSWYWNYYPSYWHPWKPYYWHYYYGYHYNSYNDYYRHYRRWDRPRYSHWNDFYYTGHRSHSTYVTVNINKGSYKTTYSRPAERRRGEALYESTHVSQNNRRAAQPTVNNNNNNSRRSSNQVVQSRQSTGNNTNVSRRTTPTTRNSGSGNTSVQNNSSARRATTTTVQNKASEQPASRQTNSGARRTTTTQTKSSAQPSSGQNTSTVRRSGTTVNRSATPPSSRQGSNSVRRTTTVKQQAAKPSSSGSSARSRSVSKPSSSSAKATTRQNSKTSSSSKSSEKKKAAEPTSNSRRK